MLTAQKITMTLKCGTVTLGKMRPDHSQVLSEWQMVSSNRPKNLPKFNKHPNISENSEGSRQGTLELATAGLESQLLYPPAV